MTTKYYDEQNVYFFFVKWLIVFCCCCCCCCIDFGCIFYTRIKTSKMKKIIFLWFPTIILNHRLKIFDENEFWFLFLLFFKFWITSIMEIYFSFLFGYDFWSSGNILICHKQLDRKTMIIISSNINLPSINTLIDD